MYTSSVENLQKLLEVGTVDIKISVPKSQLGPLY